MPGAGRNPWPACKQKTQAAGTTGSAKSSGIPCAMALRFPSRSPQGPGFLAPVVSGSFRSLDLSVGRPGPRDFAVRISDVRPHEEPCAPPTRPPHPDPRVVTTRDPPLLPGQDARIILLILRTWQGHRPCDILARRAICAWRACGNCPSCNGGSRACDAHSVPVLQQRLLRTEARPHSPCAAATSTPGERNPSHKVVGLGRRQIDLESRRAPVGVRSFAVALCMEAHNES